jgi:diguanylate cyclase (GGDEF)-like protein
MQKANHSPARRGLSINTLLILSFVVIALVPISILGFKVYDAAWDNAWREVKEKHQLLAENLASPLNVYVSTHQETLALTADLIQDIRPAADMEAIEHVLEDGLDHAKGLRSLLLLEADGHSIAVSSRYPMDNPLQQQAWFQSATFFQQAVQRHQPVVSPVVTNPFTGRITLFLATPLSNKEHPGETRVLLGELSIAFIESLRQRIRFGTNGHSAIVDQLGQVIAHPNPAWMDASITDLSNLNVVQAMMAGKTGVTEFYSPFIKDNMVAGYTAVPKLGWGVMVPQPKVEVEAQVLRVLEAQLSWALAGLAIAALAGFTLARWITRPINRLARAGRSLRKGNFSRGLPRSRDYAPREIQQLDRALGDAVDELIDSRSELDALNRSLQQRVDEATTELRRANAKLEQLALRDHLTQLANRRHFEETMASLASRRQGDSQTICLLLLDIDKFKEVNDHYGHAAGDAVLMQMGDILRNSLRSSDMAARYAGDEFIVLLRTDLATARQRAAELRETIDQHRFHFEDDSLHTTVSIGLVTCELGSPDRSLKDVLHRVDEAMYEAKRQGRNRVAEIPLKAAC